MADTTLDLHIHLIRFVCEASTLVHFGAHIGSQWRGALWETLEKFACTDPRQRGQSDHSWHCPMCFILALEAQSARGVNPVRPLIVRPPIPVRAGEDCWFEAGVTFVLELVLIEQAVNVFPYLIQAVQAIGQQGVGFGRGRFQLRQVSAVNPLTRQTYPLYETGGKVHAPTYGITGEGVAEFAAQLSPERLWLRFLTPTQLTHQDRTLARPELSAIIARTLERLQALEFHYGEARTHEIWQARHQSLVTMAQAIHIVRDETRWIRARSGSRRANRVQDVSGFVGGVLLEGDLTDLRLWLTWAALVNVGKNAVKGNGWLEVSS